MARAAQERELREAVYWLLRAYQSGHREGWEQGDSVDDTMRGMWTWLCNHGFDPALPATKRLLQRKRVPR